MVGVVMDTSVTTHTSPLISETLLHHWTDKGSAFVHTKLEAAIASLEDQAASSDQTLYRLLYELLWIVLHAKLSRQDVLTLLNDVNLSKSPQACHVLADLVWIIGNEVEANDKGRERYSSNEWQALSRFVRELADEEIVPLLTLKTTLEVDMLHQAGLMAEPAVMAKRMVRVNTKTYYTQVKFNLLREESEGFAKVLSLLHTNMTVDHIATAKTDLMALVGFFDLDANRVLDLVLDAYEMQPHNDCFTQVLALFKRDSIPHVLGFKFQFYKRDAAGEGSTEVTPVSLYRLAAMLVDKELLTVESLLPHLSPTKEEIVKEAIETMKTMETAVRAVGQVNLATKAVDAEGKEAESSVEVTNVVPHNQVYGLIMGMLEIGAEARAFEMLQWFQQQDVDPLAYEPLTKQMCAFVMALISELYAPLSFARMQFVSSTKESTFKTSGRGTTTRKHQYIQPLSVNEDWLGRLLSVIQTLGAHLHHDTMLFTKVLRVISHHIDSATTSVEREKLLTRIQPLIVSSFLPALSLQSCNPSTAFQMWDIIKLYSFDQRYRLYQQWQTAYTSHAAMQLVEAQCVQHTRRIMRRLTADRAKPSARSLTHIAHSNPLVVFRTMIRQIQSYDNLIQPVVESFKFITPLGMDVLSYVLVTELAKSRQSMKSDGTNISLWLASLANFAGSFYRKYPNVELAGLLQYLIQRLQNWESVDLVVLSELLSKMGSCITFEDISVSQLEALAGGPHLWHEPSDPKLMNRRAIPLLRDALVKRDLALPLCLLMCQVRSKMEFYEEAASSPLTHLKMLGRMFDTCQMTLSQLLQFLNSVVDPLVYTKMLPSVVELVNDYHILPELAMTMCRPAIRAHDAIFKRVPRSINAVTATNTNDTSNGTNGNNGDCGLSTTSWDMQSQVLLDNVAQAIISSSTDDPFRGMTTEMYVTFWSLVLYDIYIPFPQYEAEISRLRASLNAGGNAAWTNTERKKWKETTTQTIDKLMTEQKDQVAHRKRVFERLEEKKGLFFKKEEPDSQTAVNELLQKCIIPRAMLSPEDALFCAKFMERVHHLNIPTLLTVQYYNKVTLELPSAVLCVTEREASNFGYFLKETLTLLYRWYQSSVTYEEEAIHGKTGFSIDIHNPKNLLSHRHYKNMYAKGHRTMVKLYCTTLASREYMPIRNTLLVLTKVIDVFPSGKGAAECILEIVEALTKEDREDIKIMARRYHALLAKRKTSLVDDKLLVTGLNVPAKKPELVKQPLVAPSKDDDDNEEGEAEPVRVRRSSPPAGDRGTRDVKTRARDDDVKRSNTNSGRERNQSVLTAPHGRGDRRGAGDLENGEITSESLHDNKRGRGSTVSPSPTPTPARRDLERGTDRFVDTDRRGGDNRRAPAAAQATKSVERVESGARDGRDVSNRFGRGMETESGTSTPKPRDGQRRSRSRSAEKRRIRDRERGEKEAPSQQPLRGGSVKRDLSALHEDTRGKANVGTPTSLTHQTSDEHKRKRQHTDSMEAALRRQLTEKKVQEDKMDAKSRENKDKSDAQRREENYKSDAKNNDEKDKSDVKKRGDSDPSVSNRREAAIANEPKEIASPRKMVSLIPPSRKRDRDTAESETVVSTPPRVGTPTKSMAEGRNMYADDIASREPDQKRRHEQLNGSDDRGNGNDNRGNNRRGDDRQQPDERRRQQQHQRQPKHGGGGVGGQQRENRGGRQDLRGQGGQGRGGNNNNDRGGNNNDRRRDNNYGNDRRNNGGSNRR